jgi:hypothetical protein
MTHLDLTQDEDEALATALRRIIADDRYFLSPRIRTLRAIRNKIRPGPVHERPPPPKQYAPPRIGRRRR